MRVQSTNIRILVTRLLTIVTCIGLCHGFAFAQVDAGNQMQIDPPDVPKYRKPKPAFVIKADPDSKPLPPPPMMPDPAPVETPSVSASKAPPSPAELAKKKARLLQEDREIAASDHRQENLATLGKVLGFLLIVGLGIYAVTDIVRQVRQAKYAAAHPDDEDRRLGALTTKADGPHAIKLPERSDSENPGVQAGFRIVRVE